MANNIQRHSLEPLFGLKNVYWEEKSKRVKDRYIRKDRKGNYVVNSLGYILHYIFEWIIFTDTPFTWDKVKFVQKYLNITLQELSDVILLPMAVLKEHENGLRKEPIYNNSKFLILQYKYKQDPSRFRNSLYCGEYFKNVRIIEEIE